MGKKDCFQLEWDWDWVEVHLLVAAHGVEVLVPVVVVAVVHGGPALGAALLVAEARLAAPRAAAALQVLVAAGHGVSHTRAAAEVGVAAGALFASFVM